MEYPTQSMGQNNRNRKIFIFTILILILVVVGVAVFVMRKQTIQLGVVKEVVATPKVYTQEEKSKILEDLVKSKQEYATSPSGRERVLQKLSANVVPVNATPSSEERLRILRALEVSAGR